MNGEKKEEPRRSRGRIGEGLEKEGGVKVKEER